MVSRHEGGYRDSWVPDRLVVQTCDPRTGEAEAELPKFEATLGYSETLFSCRMQTSGE